jgi:hypothetical protein
MMPGTRPYIEPVVLHITRQELVSMVETALTNAAAQFEYPDALRIIAEREPQVAFGRNQVAGVECPIAIISEALGFSPKESREFINAFADTILRINPYVENDPASGFNSRLNPGLLRVTA